MLIFQRYSWWAGAMVALALFIAIASQVGLLSPIQGLFLRVTSPIESGMSSLVRPIATFVNDAGRIRSLQEENRALLLENEQLRNRIVELQLEAAEIDDLRQALGIIGEGGEDTFEAASVVTRDRTPGTDVVFINKGSSDGIRAGMVVLSAQGTLVGTVTGVESGRATVRLISDSRSAVSAQILNTAIDGSVRGSATRAVKLELARGTISVGDEVVTSGVGGNYPRGLPIGTVVEVQGTPQDVNPNVTIEPHVRLGTLDTVLVLTSFNPTRQALGQR
jgi:rod shape-determining protein MreC